MHHSNIVDFGVYIKFDTNYGMYHINSIGIGEPEFFPKTPYVASSTSSYNSAPLQNYVSINHENLLNDSIENNNRQV